jgi:hypothetical protein
MITALKAATNNTSTPAATQNTPRIESFAFYEVVDSAGSKTQFKLYFFDIACPLGRGSK